MSATNAAVPFVSSYFFAGLSRRRPRPKTSYHELPRARRASERGHAPRGDGVERLAGIEQRRHAVHGERVRRGLPHDVMRREQAQDMRCAKNISTEGQKKQRFISTTAEKPPLPLLSRFSHHPRARASAPAAAHRSARKKWKKGGECRRTDLGLVDARALRDARRAHACGARVAEELWDVRGLEEAQARREVVLRRRRDSSEFDVEDAR